MQKSLTSLEAKKKRIEKRPLKTYESPQIIDGKNLFLYKKLQKWKIFQERCWFPFSISDSFYKYINGERRSRKLIATLKMENELLEY